MTEQRGTVAGLGALVGAATLFSFGFVVVKALPLPPATLAFARLVVGGVFVSALALAARAPLPERIAPVLGAGLFFAAHQLLYIAATHATSIAIVTLLGAMQPLLVALVSHRVVGERPPPALFGWALLAAAGVGVVVWANLDDPSASLLGDLLAVVNILAFTGFFLFSKRAREEGTHTLTLTAAVALLAAVFVSPALLFVSEPLPSGAREWGLVALLALGPGNGHLLVNWAHRRLTAALSSLTLTLVPLLASIWAHLFFDEPYGPRHVVGMVLVVVAVEGGRRAELAAARQREYTKTESAS